MQTPPNTPPVTPSMTRYVLMVTAVCIAVPDTRSDVEASYEALRAAQDQVRTTDLTWKVHSVSDRPFEIWEGEGEPPTDGAIEGAIEGADEPPTTTPRLITL